MAPSKKKKHTTHTFTCDAYRATCDLARLSHLREKLYVEPEQVRVCRGMFKWPRVIYFHTQRLPHLTVASRQHQHRLSPTWIRHTTSFSRFPARPRLSCFVPRKFGGRIFCQFRRCRGQNERFFLEWTELGLTDAARVKLVLGSRMVKKELTLKPNRTRQREKETVSCCVRPTLVSCSWMFRKAD